MFHPTHSQFVVTKRPTKLSGFDTVAVLFRLPVRRSSHDPPKLMEFFALCI